MSASSTISNLQSALNCAGKCDCCDKLQSQINAINAKIAGLKNIDENALKTSIRASLQPDITSAVGAAIAILANRLDPQIKNLINGLSDARQRANSAERLASEAKSASDAMARQKYASLSALEQEVRQREYGDNLHNQGYSKQKIDQMLSDERLAASLREAKGQQALQAEYRNLVRAEQARASGAETSIGSRAGEAFTKASQASGTALNAANEVSGLRGLLNGVSNKIAGLEARIGEAITKAAEAIGISKQALSATARMAGQILEIFNVIGTIFTILDGMATREALGARIDALENQIVAVGADVSRILGKLLGLQGRIASNEATIGQVRGIATEAKNLANIADSHARSAQATAARASGYATTAQAKAQKAQDTADGAVRNAKQANDNAVTAYQKATNAENIGQKALRIGGEALNKAGEALGTALTVLALYQTVKALKGLKGDPGVPGARGLQGIPGKDGKDGITTVVTLPGIPGRDGKDGLPGIQGARGLRGERGIQGISGKDGKDGKDMNPGDLAGLKALIISQHNQTRANSNAQHNSTRAKILAAIGAAFAPVIAICKQIYDIVSKFSDAAQLALLNIINNKLGKQVTGGLSQFIETIAKNTYVEKALAVLTFAATIHNAFMLSNNLAQTLGTVIDQCVSFILPKGIDGQPITIGDALGKLAHEIIADAIGEANYKKISEEWALANRIYQATTNVFNTVGNAVATISAGMEVIGGNVGKIGNALKIWGVLGEKAYGWMNPQPNLQGKFFNHLTGATDALNTINAVIQVPLAVTQAVIEVNSARTALQASLNQEDPKDKNEQPIRDALGNPLKYEPGTTVPDPTKTTQAQEQASADSTNILVATIEDLFDAGE